MKIVHSQVAGVGFQPFDVAHGHELAVSPEFVEGSTVSGPQ